MKGNPQIIEALNSLLSDELSAINEYMVHSEMCANWGYDKLHLSIRKQAMEEMHHAEWLIERIIYLDGLPEVSKLNKITISKTVVDMIHTNDSGEMNALSAYNNVIKLARELDDQGTVDLLTKILKMEEGHVDWAEMQMAQMEQMGIKNYLANQSTSTIIN